MQCPSCKSDNPEGKPYCGDCGLPIDADAERLRQQITRIISGQFRDRGLVEVEVTDRVLGRLQIFAKVFGFSFALFIAALAFFGIRSYTDAAGKLNEASGTAIANLQRQASVQEKNLRQESDRAVATLQKFTTNPELEALVRQAATRTRQYDARVAALEQAAKEDQAKVAQLAELRKHAPSTPIGDLNPRLFQPYSSIGIPSDGTTPFPSTENLLKNYAVGSKGTDVEKIQQRLKTLGCYEGELTGNFDEATAKAVAAFKQAQQIVRIPALTSFPVTGSLQQVYEGNVDYVTWSTLFGLLSQRCNGK
jgi:hypothetical protein